MRTVGEVGLETSISCVRLERAGVTAGVRMGVRVVGGGGRQAGGLPRGGWGKACVPAALPGTLAGVSESKLS